MQVLSCEFCRIYVNNFFYKCQWLMLWGGGNRGAKIAQPETNLYNAGQTPPAKALEGVL